MNSQEAFSIPAPELCKVGSPPRPGAVDSGLHPHPLRGTLP
jgi:hypothetical protein